MMAAERLSPLSLAAALRPPNAGVIEIERGHPCRPGDSFLHHLQLGGLGLAIATGTAHRCDLAFTFTTALMLHYPQWQSREESIARVLHEAVTNAIVHGNLDVATPTADLDGFHAYCAALDAALDDPAKAGRPIEISAVHIDGLGLQLAVRDHGRGFVPAPVETHTAEPREHGLSIISSLSRLRILEGGRCAEITFRDEES
ncbi:hypothetical protein A6A04_10125 [Paramagnetospirillum marisnigri]|uniref:Histidine kinase/HSP90-like ATPase domain-containing protein n=2 Tax=Paramagnetospirillum marisnigri TaxID=1285242 RepID=A0A178M464_9PROT|nr:hypothetical protein A6A04_10125 [Paramagnetospirillum marisnigri]